jgi:hypothetical protein
VEEDLYVARIRHDGLEHVLHQHVGTARAAQGRNPANAVAFAEQDAQADVQRELKLE